MHEISWSFQNYSYLVKVIILKSPKLGFSGQSEKSISFVLDLTYQVLNRTQCHWQHGEPEFHLDFSRVGT